VSGSLVSPDLRARVRGLAEPVARGFGRLGLTPNHLTLIGFGLAILAAVGAAAGAWLVAGLLVIVGGVFDLFDGALARATGRANRLGAFYDSVFDRWGEGIVYVGVAWGCMSAGYPLGAVLAGAALASAFMVSYTRAKSESLGFTPGTGMANVGLAPREVRIVILTIGLLAVGLLDPSYLEPVVGGFLGLIALLATVTTIQRIVHARNQARED
jgi:phosphatidylglycerophosphate synthase